MFTYKTEKKIYDQEIFKVAKKGELSMDWVKEKMPRKKPLKKALAIITPDVGSNSHARHLRYLALKLHSEGYKTLVY